MSRYQLDGYTAIERVRREMRSFVHSSFRFRNAVLDEAVHEAISRFGLVAPPVVEATFPFEIPTKGPKTTRELASVGLLHPDLPKLLGDARGEARWPEDRPLYKHQVEAIEHYRKGKSLVVASGTGSGKTECFLLPALDTLLRDPGSLHAGRPRPHRLSTQRPREQPDGPAPRYFGRPPVHPVCALHRTPARDDEGGHAQGEKERGSVPALSSSLASSSASARRTSS